MHARKTARDAFFPFAEDDVFFLPRRGDVIFRDLASARAFADRVNRRRGTKVGPELRPADVAAMAFVHEVLHAVIGVHRSRNPDSFERMSASMEASLGPGVRQTLLDFLATFPPPAVYRTLSGQGDETPERWLERAGPGAEVELGEELLLLWITNQNPAYEPVHVIVGDDDLGPGYAAFVAHARRLFDEEASIGPKGETLVELLLAPAREHPRSIFDQVDYIERNWGGALGLDTLPLWRRRIAALRDLRTEEGRWFSRGGPGPGEPLLEAMRFDKRKDEEASARFSPDLGWMPNVVLLAKSVYVWLDQLTKKYGRYIHRLDQVPDEELDQLASRGLNALWLIGLFERSRASQKIKQMRGDHEALASAYSLKRYVIAEELGGAEAYENLKARAGARGIRLAADMVPNHVGIDGDWVIEHPDWFLQARTPPFPNYRFGGPDLSSDARVGVFLEEGYWDRTDAAVVFRRHDRWTGEDRFIYHGNDGTSMPWNDTAQLDYLRADVRAAVIETILHVARMFPIVRFDAAMTLAKRHIQRLWFPLPGEGGAIPSRSDYAMTEEEFDRAIPVEFWREVVDAVAARAPDTLLLAEAFWMMEGYFVRTLGMHRVYNSAFMNMLKREDNEKYRATIKNVLDFDAEILKRFVNFMNNPDEETAYAQFGDGDKYFGVCVLMCTMPGLPMFGHGQIEGLREKYGMEYRRARWDEHPNEALVRRHEREILPLLHARYLFSGVESFALYDFVTDSGEVDEDVYAYSNRADGSSSAEVALVVFLNRYKATRGRIQRSTHRADLATELGIDPTQGEWLVIRDVTGGLEYLRPARDVVLGGMAWELRAFEYHVFTGFSPVRATFERPYDRLAAELAGRGVPDVEEAARRLYLRPIHAPLREACGAGHRAFLKVSVEAPDGLAEARAAMDERLGHVADGLDWMLSQRAGAPVAVARERALATASERLGALHAFLLVHGAETEARGAETEARGAETEARGAETEARGAEERPGAGVAKEAAPGPPIDVDLALVWIQVEAVLDLLASACEFEPAPAREPMPEPELEPAPERELKATTWADREALLVDWDLATPVVEALALATHDEDARRRAAMILLAATLPMGPLASALRLALDAPRGEALMNVHASGGVSWLVEEPYEELARCLAEREAVFGQTSLRAALEEADVVIAIAREEGYRAERIAERLGPATSSSLAPSRD